MLQTPHDHTTIALEDGGLRATSVETLGKDCTSAAATGRGPEPLPVPMQDIHTEIRKSVEKE